MADDRSGTVHMLSGKAEEGVSRAVDAGKAEVGNLKDQAADAVKDAYAKTVDAAADGVGVVKDAAIAGHDFLKEFMEENPHTTTIIALGLGVLIGYAATRQPPRRGWWD